MPNIPLCYLQSTNNLILFCLKESLKTKMAGCISFTYDQHHHVLSTINYCVGMERLKGVVEVGEIYIDSKVVTNTLIKFNTTQRRVVF